jgi:glutathione reductase (NADPH)
METVPDVAVVVGAGYIAVELAGILNALGSEVHLVLMNDNAFRSNAMRWHQCRNEEIGYIRLQAHARFIQGRAGCACRQ